MPEGISVVVDDLGYATIDVADSALRGRVVDKLIKVGGPSTVERLTPHGRPVYRVPEGNARAAGLLDTAAPVADADADSDADADADADADSDADADADADSDSDADSDADADAAYPTGEPTTEWTLAELKAYATDHGKDAHKLRIKHEVLELISK